MSSTISSEQWDQRKAEILRLYIDEGLTLKPVMRKMQSPDFRPTESQYRTKLKKWKRRKARQNTQQGAHTGPAHSITAAVDQSTLASTEDRPTGDCPIEAITPALPSPPEESVSTMVPSHPANQWSVPSSETEGRFGTSLAGAQMTTHTPTPMLEYDHVQSSHDIVPDLCYSQEFFNLDEYRAMAKKRASESIYGNHGHARVGRDPRMRAPSSSYHPKPSPITQYTLEQPPPSHIAGIQETQILGEVCPTSEYLIGSRDPWWTNEGYFPFSATSGVLLTPGREHNPMF